MRTLLFICIFILSGIHVFGQENTEEKNFGINFSGFVKNDFFWDTRQVVAVREGHFLLWPTGESLDENGNDINAQPNFNFLALQSRLTGKITGPDAFGAKTSGVIEGDFFAQANDNINLFRLRHAFIKLKWANTELITGQYWNPLFVTKCFPGTVSFNTGTPFQSFARNPQIRLTHSISNFNFMLAALAQRDYTSRYVGVSSEYLRNSAVPDMHFQLQYDSDPLLIGAGVEYKTIVPRLSSTINGVDTVTYKVDEKVSSLAAIAYTTIKLNPLTIKLQGRYGENIPDVLSISGFAIKEETDAVTGERSYTPITNFTIWGDISTNGEKLQTGIFAGYLQNLGTKEEMSEASNENNTFALGRGIESLIRVSPRVSYKSGKYKVALELEYTIANFGSGYDNKYIAKETTQVANLRTLMSAYYFF